MRLAILSVVLFLSGVSALIFETLWLRLAGLVFGNSVWAAALILSSFMAGLALGNAVGGTFRLRGRPLYVYALLELTVAVSGCAIVFALPLLGQWVRPVFQALWAHQSVLLLLRFLLSFVILLVPTTAMGLSLPVLVAEPLLQRYRFGTALGLLYGLNTLGAVCGAVVEEAYLVSAFGLTGTGLTAAAVSVTAAILSCVIAATGLKKPQPHPASVVGHGPGRLRTALPSLIISFGAGMLLLCLEVAWLRFLRLYVASSATAFAATLSVILAGIGLGGVVSSLLQRMRSSREHLPSLLLLLAAILTVICYRFFPTSAARASAGPFYLDQWRELLLLSGALTFPVALASGVLFPLVAANVEAVLGDRMNSVGWATLLNTVGASVGPLLASFVLLPHFGFQSAILLCAGAYALLATATTRWRLWLPTRITGAVRLALLVVLLVAFFRFPYSRADAHLAHARELFVNEGSRLVKRIDGTADTLQLLQRQLYGEPYYYRLVTDAFSMSATSITAQRYMRLFAYLPLTLNPKASDALLICYGCGVTADALVRAAQLKKVDMVDIAHEVFELAPDYAMPGYVNPLSNPKATAIVQDGRFFLQSSPLRYDLITGEPPPLKVLGAVNLYTAEFFTLMRDRLNEGGIASFWLPIEQLTAEETKSILRAFHSAFPNASVWGGPDTQWIMVGVNGSLQKLTREDMSRLWREESRADLVRIGIEAPDQLAALFLMDAKGIDELTEGSLPLTDNWPKRLTDAHTDDKITDRFGWNYVEGLPALKRFLSSPVRDTWPEMPERELEEYFLVRETRYLARAIRSNQMAELDLYLRHSRLRTPVLDVLGTDEIRIAIAERVTRRLGTPPQEAIGDLVAAALARRDIAAAVGLLENKIGPSFTPNDLFLLTYLYCLHGEIAKAEQLASDYSASVDKDWFVDWLWKKLHDDFGFQPPA